MLFINNYMTDSEYKLRQATLNWMVAQAESYTHALTLTLKQSRKVKTERGELVERLTRYSATTNMRHFINRLNAALYGNAAKTARGGKCVFHPDTTIHFGPNPASDSGRNRPPAPPETLPPVPIQSRPPIPKQTRRAGGLISRVQGLQAAASFRLRCLRIDSPLSSNRCDPLTRRSRIASATVGLPPLK